MPPGAIYVGRGSLWGNPFVIGKPSGLFFEGEGGARKAEILIPELSLDQAIEFYRELISGILRPEMYPAGHAWRNKFDRRVCANPEEVASVVLGGHDLACWCALDQRCHADVLLEIANRR
jgi:hypothetical protein